MMLFQNLKQNLLSLNLQVNCHYLRMLLCCTGEVVKIELSLVVWKEKRGYSVCVYSNSAMLHQVNACIHLVGIHVLLRNVSRL